MPSKEKSASLKEIKRIIPAKKSVYLEGPKAAAMNFCLA